MKAGMLSPARLIVGILAVVALSIPSGAVASAGGDSNAGDFWVDTVGAPLGPGHEMDPHLPCADINLWGDKMADSTDSYTIDGWEPSGSKGQAYASTWHYDRSKGGSQIMDVINVQTLIANAAANGDTPAAQGYHFKIQFVQDPQKHKTFWIDCPPPSSQSGQGGDTGGTTQGTQPGTTEQGTTQPGTSGQQGVLGVRRSGRSHRKHRARRHHRKHHHVKRKAAVLPAFTG